MKIKLLVFAAVCISVANFKVEGFSQPQDNTNYVVIGAFAIQGNAAKFIEAARKLNFNAVSEINPKRNLFYVYVMHTDDRQTAFQEAIKLRKATPYFDTWVYTGLLGSGGTGTDLHPASETAITAVEAKDLGQSPKVEDNPAISNPVEIPVVEKKETVIQDAEPGSRNFLFKVFSALDEKELAGDIDLIDVEKSKKVASYDANKNVVVQSVNKSGNISLVCNVFGYRKMQKDLNFETPTGTVGVVTEGNQTIVPFELSRLAKGDIAIMYNVYFFKDAAIMRPESRYEVNSLLEMMKDNPKYKIRIHGHTNGKAAGKVISMGESKKFFALQDTKEGFGSAKKLSEERAKVIREYLVTQGIDASRMEIKAWGGKKPIHDKMSPQAQGNVRVEIEILEDK